MITSMRTTLVIDDRLLRQAKARAAAQGTTLSEVVSQALRSVLAEPASPPAAFQMLVFGEPSSGARHAPGDFYDPPPDDDRRRPGR
jgi:hypothetical protein